MKKLTKKEIDLTLDLIQMSISQISEYELNDNEYSVYERLGKCKCQTIHLSNFIKNGYDDDSYKTYTDELTVYYAHLLSKVICRKYGF